MAPYHYRPPCLATTVANFDFFRVFVVLDDLERLTTATKVFAALGRKKRSLDEIGSSWRRKKIGRDFVFVGLFADADD